MSNPEQPMKAPSPIVKSPSCNVKVVTAVQPENAVAPMDVTDFGIIKFPAKAVQLLKELIPIVKSPSCSVRLVIELQPSNAESPTEVKDDGNDRLVKLAKL